MVEAASGVGGFNPPVKPPHPDSQQVQQSIELNKGKLGITGETQGYVKVSVKGGKVELDFAEWQKGSNVDEATKQAMKDNLPKLLQGTRDGNLTVRIRVGGEVKVA
jgi:hypothetical protein